LRGINVGGHTVTMDRLREVFQSLGLGAVSTLIASGNVLFEAEQEAPQSLERRIEEALRQALGYEVATFVRSDAEIAEVAAYAPFPDAEIRAGDTNHILFLQQAPDGATRGRVEALSNEDDRFRVHQRELYWLRRGRLSDTTIKDADLNRALGKAQVTARNANTVRRLAAKLWPA
jgi:uncharacterized protein (DUF1697 family)